MCTHDFATTFDDKCTYYITITENETHGNWIALVMPDDIPFKLGLMTYAATLVMLHEEIEHGNTLGKYEEDNLNACFVGGLKQRCLCFEGTTSRYRHRKPSTTRNMTRSTICDVSSHRGPKLY